MREIKFDLVMKNKHTGDIHHKKYFLAELMMGIGKLFDIENYETVANRQFTGLADKNGVEIYESDVVTYDLDRSPQMKGVIKWDDIKARFCIEECILWGLNSRDVSTRAEVIGSIYEHPELINNEQ